MMRTRKAFRKAIILKAFPDVVFMFTYMNIQCSCGPAHVLETAQALNKINYSPSATSDEILNLLLLECDTRIKEEGANGLRISTHLASPAWKNLP